MMNGFFLGGLAEAEADAAARRRAERASRRGPERDEPPGGAPNAHQARRDVATMALGLARARQAGDPQSYDGLKHAVTPVLLRSAAQAVAAKRGLSVSGAARPARELTRLLIARLESLPGGTGGGANDPTGTEDGDRSGGQPLADAQPLPALAREGPPFGRPSTARPDQADDADGPLPIADGKIDLAGLKVGRLYRVDGARWRWTGHDFEAVD
ncbi:MAG: hypothetical protein L6R19_27645 [Alphaproteobacteria bacterium]|nr:hypothetical protein [Alphaproteobacteria bacterium]